MGCASSSPAQPEDEVANVKNLPVLPVKASIKAPISLELQLYYARALQKMEEKEAHAQSTSTSMPPPAAVVEEMVVLSAALPPVEKVAKPVAKPTKPVKMTRLDRYYTEAWKKLQQPHTCNICMEDNVELEMMCARGSPDKLTVQQAREGCGHFACKDCMQAYVCNSIESRKFPILCTDSAGGCSRWVMYGDVINLLTTSGQQKNLQALQQLEIEHAIPQKLRVYCPYKDCSTLLMKPKKACEVNMCPQCKRDFCPSCLFEGCHEGMTCAEVLLLPVDQQNSRALEERLSLRLLSQKDWKPCPKCKIVVERIDGCNYVHCRCGCGFCYRCGLEYLSKKATDTNYHGVPACKCQLFNYDHIL